MRKLINIFIFVLISTFFISCKKQDYHKVSFEITFLGTPNTGSSNFIEVYALPNYSDKKPNIDRFNVPQVWKYEYIGLEKGDKVYFLVRGQLSYYFEMRVFIDGVQKSYRRVIVSDNSYYDDHVEESYGLNDKSDQDTGIIEFIY
jgi:hypothetical protein